MSAGGIAVAIHPQLLSQLASSEVPANVITTDDGDPITTDDGDYITTDE